MFSDDGNPLNQVYDEAGTREVFKYRRLVDRKVFRLSDLPDAYRLISTQGRGNVHEFHGMREHIRLLADSTDSRTVRDTLSGLPFDETVKLLGPSAWESLCTAYLTLEHGFVTTGLSTGRTLPTFDIVGRRVPDGMHIFAQCKKDWQSVAVEDSFTEALATHPGPYKAFYFAYGGCRGPVPAGTEVIGRDKMLKWVETDRGAMYRRFLLGE